MKKRPWPDYHLFLQIAQEVDEIVCSLNQLRSSLRTIAVRMQEMDAGPPPANQIKGRGMK